MVMEGTVKIRMKTQTIEGPAKLRVTPNYDAIFDEHGIASVPRHVAVKLLGPGYPGLYELVKEEPAPASAPPIAKPTAAKPGPKPKTKEPAPAQEELDRTKVFADTI